MSYQLRKLSATLESLGLHDESDMVSELLSSPYIQYDSADIVDELMPNESLTSSYGEMLLRKMASLLEGVGDESDVEIIAEILTGSLDKDMLHILSRELESHLE